MPLTNSDISLRGGGAVYECHGGSVVVGVYDKLGIVGATQLGCVCILEAGRRHAVKGGNVAYALVGLHHVAQTVGHGSRAFDARSLWQVNLYGKLITFGTWQKLLRHLRKERGTKHHRECTNTQSDERMGKTTFDKTIVITLHDVEKGATLSAKIS